MRVLMGNPAPVGTEGPTVTYADLMDLEQPDGSFNPSYIVGSDAQEIKEHLMDNPGLVTHLPGNGAVLGVIRSWADHATTKPTWVVVEPGARSEEEAADFERFLSEYWRCDRGYPDDLEETHNTFAGPPGVGPSEGE